MFRLTEPRTADVRDFLQEVALEPFSYPDIGSTRGKRPRGYNVDVNRIRLGAGQAIYERSRKNLRDWRMFATDWVKLCWPYKKLTPGTVVAIVASHFGFYSVNAARIVYAVDDLQRYGFAYGTLPRHFLRGETLFVVEKRADDSIWFQMTTISRPGHWLTWVFYPVSRRLQRRFALDAMHAMLEALAGPDLAPAADSPTAAQEG